MHWVSSPEEVASLAIGHFALPRKAVHLQWRSKRKSPPAKNEGASEPLLIGSRSLQFSYAQGSISLQRPVAFGRNRPCIRPWSNTGNRSASRSRSHFESNERRLGQAEQRSWRKMRGCSYLAVSSFFKSSRNGEGNEQFGIFASPPHFRHCS